MADIDQSRNREQPSFLSRDVRETQLFFLELHPDPAAALTVVGGGIEWCAPTYSIQRSGFVHHAIECVLDGRGTLQLGGRAETTLAPGMVFSYGPGIPHVIQTSRQHPLVKFFIDFAGREASGLVGEAGWQLGRAAWLTAPEDVFALCEMIVRVGSRSSVATQAMVTHLLRVLCLAIGTSAVSKPVDARALATYRRVRDLMERDPLQFESLVDVARVAKVDPSYLCRLFQRYERTTPYRCLVHLKMNRAATLLKTRPMLIKEVAAAVGYNDPYQFSRIFTRVFGVSPQAFREAGAPSRMK